MEVQDGRSTVRAEQWIGTKKILGQDARTFTAVTYVVFTGAGNSAGGPSF